MKMKMEEYQAKIRASKEVFKTPSELLKKRDEIFDRQLYILSQMTHKAIQNPYRAKNHETDYAKRKMAVEYRYNQIDLKNLDKEITRLYEYKVCENNSIKKTA